VSASGQDQRVSSLRLEFRSLCRKPSSPLAADKLTTGPERRGLNLHSAYARGRQASGTSRGTLFASSFGRKRRCCELRAERSKGSSRLSLSLGAFRVASRRGSPPPGGAGATRRRNAAEEATRSTPLGVVQPAAGSGGGDRP